MRNRFCEKNQSAFNKVLRRLNKDIERDNIWRGRFVCRQVNAVFDVFEDGSGCAADYFVLFFDKLTKKRTLYRLPFFTGTRAGLFRPWEAMNSFITTDVKAPVKNEGDFTKVGAERFLRILWNSEDMWILKNLCRSVR